MLLLFGAIWLIVTLFFSDKEDSAIISIEKENKIGEFFYESLIKDTQFKEIGSAFTDSCMLILSERITDSLDTEYEYYIHIFNNPMINAFALPGGHIMVSSGLIEISDNPEELAGVLCHEMAHIEKKHLLGKLIKEMGIALILSNDALIVSEVSRAAASTAYDRNKEEEADEFALELLQKSRIDPRVLGIFFRKMKDADVDYDKRFEMLMTHPHSSSRIRNALEYELPDIFNSVPIDLDWDEFKTVVDSLMRFKNN